MEQATEAKKSGPAEVISKGSVKAKIWKNSGSSGEWYSASLSRSYKQGDEWKETNCFGQKELPKAIEALSEAKAWIEKNSAPKTA
jgi:hypothetical protein